jgi:glutamate synthase (NADPH/NADH) large chain/glutamate synthase (ferredoxin)
MGCIYMRACHLNTCPVGIATQDEELRKRFQGQPENVVNFFFMLAEEVRSYMARLGVRKFEDLVGRVDLLKTREAIDHWKAKGVDLSKLLAPPAAAPEIARRRVRPQDPVLDDHLDHQLIAEAHAALERGEPVNIETKVVNAQRTVGGLLSGEIARRYGAKGLPENCINITAHGSGGQSFGAWLAPGVTITLFGDANDYAGKGMSGGVLAVRPPEAATYKAEENVIVGNTLLYGATSGKAFFSGLAGERFGVRNSGVHTVVEGVGDHGCEYMTGGRVVVLGQTGRNFAAGMSGGIAYVLDKSGTFHERCNMGTIDLETPGADDLEEVHALVKEHYERTGSDAAKEVLENWVVLQRAWVKVMPKDFKRVLAEREARHASSVRGMQLSADGSGVAESGMGIEGVPDHG